MYLYFHICAFALKYLHTCTLVSVLTHKFTRVCSRPCMHIFLRLPVHLTSFHVQTFTFRVPTLLYVCMCIHTCYFLYLFFLWKQRVSTHTAGETTGGGGETLEQAPCLAQGSVCDVSLWPEPKSRSRRSAKSRWQPCTYTPSKACLGSQLPFLFRANHSNKYSTQWQFLYFYHIFMYK